MSAVTDASVLTFTITVKNQDGETVAFQGSEAGQLPFNGDPLRLAEAMQASAWALVHDYEASLNQE